MATSESTPSPEKKPLRAVPVEEFFKWDDLEEIHLHGLKDSSSDEDTTEREARPEIGFQQEKSPEASTETGRHSKPSSSPVEEPQEPALTQQKGRKWHFKFPKWKRRGQYQVESKSPTGKLKSLSPETAKRAALTAMSHMPSLSPPSHKSPTSPISPEQEKAEKFSPLFEGSKEGEYSASVINLGTITDQVGVPEEVSIKHKYVGACI